MNFNKCVVPECTAFTSLSLAFSSNKGLIKNSANLKIEQDLRLKEDRKERRNAIGRNNELCGTVLLVLNHMYTHISRPSSKELCLTSK